MSIKMKRVMDGILDVPFSLIMSPFSTGQDVSQIQIKITPLAEGIFMLEEAGGKPLKKHRLQNDCGFGCRELRWNGARHLRTHCL